MITATLISIAVFCAAVILILAMTHNEWQYESWSEGVEAFAGFTFFVGVVAGTCGVIGALYRMFA